MKQVVLKSGFNPESLRINHSSAAQYKYMNQKDVTRLV